MQPNVRHAVSLIVCSIIHVVSAACVDKVDECNLWAKTGECYKNPRYMLLHCPKSCGVCGNQAVKPMVEDNDDNKYCESGVCTRILDIHMSDNCQDRFRKDPLACKSWAESGECHINPEFMMTQCAKSCGVCSALNETTAHLGTDSHCFDNDPMGECVDHVMNGDCYFDSSNMIKKCAASCFKCVNRIALEKDGKTPEEINRRLNYRNLKMGIHQERLGRDLAEQYHVVEQIKAMDMYAKTVVADTDVSDTGRFLCTNQLAECAYYASKGFCTKRLMFMMSNCPLACLMCEEVEQFHRCSGKTHPLDVPSFANEVTFASLENTVGARSITSYFNKFTSDVGATAITNPDEPNLYTIDNVFSDVETNEILRLIQGMTEWTDSKVQRSNHFDGKYSSTLPARKSQSLSCEDPALACYNKTMDMMSKISTKLDIPESYFDFPEFVHYSPGGYYSPHHEYRIHDEWKPAGPRVLTVYIPLTDHFSDSIQGGSIGFPGLQWTVLTPKKGSIVVWSNLDENHVPISSVETEILPITSGDHYILVTHVHLHDYKRNFQMNCS